MARIKQPYLRRRLDTFINPLVYTFWSDAWWCQTSAVELTRSVNITVSRRRSASSRLAGWVSTGAATEALAKSRIARSILRR